VREAAIGRPRLHLFVCGNRRTPDAPLGPGCGAAGEELFARLKQAVADARAYTTVWVTQTGCLGICPRNGAAVASYPDGGLFADATAADAPALLARAAPSVEDLLVEMEQLQATKVLELARRLRPGLTFEDVKNPHDFPELADPDWHYEDGILTGIQSVLTAVRAEQRRGRGEA
jgi:predicted metal-binding protein